MLQLGDEIASKRLADQHRQTNVELTEKQAAMESIKQMMVEAEKTYLDRHRLLQEELAREARAVKAGAEHDQLLGLQTQKFQLKQVRENKLESDLRKLDALVEPVRPQPGNVTVADTDMRPKFILAWIGIVTAFFFVLMAINFTAPAASSSHDDVEAVGHAMVEDYEVPSPPPHTGAHPKPVIPAEPTRV